ncbi:BamA/TamA family outer membrane protein [Halosquirtibacter xylanolyticus]|uniref:BamA/TamA family outer membrane protein n=1 Tax=Halosquirtibacter xylanolyticus TaxID=3374599 RepID=UPI003748747C|nr:BamA/TamA family outer membrane protein [Prolixibacteraceae bacterium]
MKRFLITTVIAIFFVNLSFGQVDKWSDPKLNPDNFTLLDGFKKKKMEKMLKEGKNDEVKKKQEEAKNKKVYSVFLPVVAYNPFTSLILGVGGNLSTKFGDSSTTRFSNFVPSYTYTLNNQQTFRLNSNLYTNNNDYYIFSSLMWAMAPQSTYGVGGDNPEDWKTIVEPKTFKVVLRAYKKIKENIYIGVNYSLDWKYQIEDEDAVDIQNIISSSPDATTASDAIDKEFNDGLDEFWVTEGINYSGFEAEYDPSNAVALQQKYYYTPFGDYNYGTGDHSVASGIGVNFLLDSRDNVNSTYEGAYVNVAYTYYGEWLGSTSDFQSLLIDARYHIPLCENKRQVLAFWGMANLTFGDTPYFSLPRIGGDDWYTSGRGYTAGRYLGEKLLYAEAEYRINVKKWFGLTGFINAHSVTEDNDKFEYVNVAGGIGFRARILKSRTDINADFGYGKEGSHGVYLRFTQAF